MSDIDCNMIMNTLKDALSEDAAVPSYRQLNTNDVKLLTDQLASRLGIRHVHDHVRIPILLGSMPVAEFPRAVDAKAGEIRIDALWLGERTHIRSDELVYCIFNIHTDIISTKYMHVPRIVSLIQQHCCAWHGAFVLSMDLEHGLELCENNDVVAFRVAK